MKHNKFKIMIADISTIWREKVAKDEGDLPVWFLIFKAGEIELADGTRFLVDQEAFNRVAKEFAARGNDIVVDYEHKTLSGDPAPAAGWIKELKLIPDQGIFARIEWTQKASEYITAGEYRYFSPVFLISKNDSRLSGLHSLALTNTPKTNHIAPLVAKLTDPADHKPNKEDFSMDLTKILTKLGLKEDADEATLEAKIDELINKEPEVKEVITKDILTALDLQDGDASVVVASINALKQAPKGMVSREEYDTLKAEIADDKAEKVVAKAMAAGKVTPDQKDWALDYAKKDPKGFDIYIAKAPVVIPVDKLPEKKTKTDPLMDEDVLKVAKMVGNTVEDLKKYATA